jgi:hypothetical protein
MEIVEKVQHCHLVRKGTEDNGHDCWGNYEYTTYKYVMINGKKEMCWDDWYVIHDGEKVKEITTENILKIRKERKEHFEKTGFETPREYAAYLKGKNEMLNINK